MQALVSRHLCGLSLAWDIFGWRRALLQAIKHPKRQAGGAGGALQGSASAAQQALASLAAHSAAFCKCLRSRCLLAGAALAGQGVEIEGVEARKQEATTARTLASSWLKEVTPLHCALALRAWAMWQTPRYASGQGGQGGLVLRAAVASTWRDPHVGWATGRAAAMSGRVAMLAKQAMEAAAAEDGGGGRLSAAAAGIGRSGRGLRLADEQLAAGVWARLREAGGDGEDAPGVVRAIMLAAGAAGAMSQGKREAQSVAEAAERAGRKGAVRLVELLLVEVFLLQRAAEALDEVLQASEADKAGTEAVNVDMGGRDEEEEQGEECEEGGWTELDEPRAPDTLLEQAVLACKRLDRRRLKQLRRAVEWCTVRSCTLTSATTAFVHLGVLCAVVCCFSVCVFAVWIVFCPQLSLIVPSISCPPFERFCRINARCEAKKII